MTQWRIGNFFRASRGHACAKRAGHAQESGHNAWAGVLAAGLALLCGAAAMAQDTESTISAGDLIFVDVYRRAELSTTTQVDVNGNITLPYVGNVKIVGLTEKDASACVSAALGKILKNPRVTVSRSVRQMGLGARTAEMQTQMVNLTNSSAEALYNALAGMTSEGGSIGFDPNTNTLIITDTPGAIQNMMAVIAQLDQMQSQVTQVHIETKIAEVKEGAMKELGIRWFAKGKEATGGYYPVRAQDPIVAGSRGGQTGALANETVGGDMGGRSGMGGGGGGRQFVEEAEFDRRLALPVHVPTVGQLFFGLLNEHVDLGILLDALVAESKAEMLANPSILTVNHQEAHIKMTDEYPYTEYVVQAYGTRGSTRFIDLGIKLGVTPHVYRDAGGVYVQLELEPEVSFYNGSNNGVPIRAVRSSNTVTNVRDGQTLVIGGIVMAEQRNVEHRVPGLGRVPIVGNLFKHKERVKDRRELMIFVTPTVHESPETITWDRMLNLSIASETGTETLSSLEARRESRRE